MANNILNIHVADLTTVLESYDQIKVYRAVDADSTYSEITTSSDRITLNSQDSLYTYTEVGALTTYYYKTSYFNSSSSDESQLSGAVVASTVSSNQLVNNMLITITLAETIKSLTDIELDSEEVFYFTTKYDPLYSSVRKLRLEIGSFISSLDDDTLNLAIFEASLMADQLTFATVNDESNQFYVFARKEWTTCKAAQILLMNSLGQGGLRSKKLDNLEVTYDANQGADILNKINECLARWEAQLMSGGNATQKPSYVVKGELDVDAPNVGRLWEKGLFVEKTPGSNLRYRAQGSRRWIGGWRGSWK